MVSWGRSVLRSQERVTHLDSPHTIVAQFGNVKLNAISRSDPIRYELVPNELLLYHSSLRFKRQAPQKALPCTDSTPEGQKDAVSQIRRLLLTPADTA